MPSTPKRNDLSANAVVVFDRSAGGSLKQRQVVPTGGKGNTQSVGCGPGCPILDTSGEVALTRSGRILFAVNAGSNTVSSFRETGHGLKLVDQQPSGGLQPESVTTARHLVYVLNDNSGTISGFRFNSSGKLTPIPGSTQSLKTTGPMGAGRQIGFDNTGQVLVVTEVGMNLIDTFVLGHGDTPGPVTATPSASMFPFGFAFDPSNRIVISELTSMMGTGSTSTYNLTGAGAVSPIDTEGTNGILPCWVAVTPDGRYVFVVNTGAGMPAPISRYSLGPNGKLTLLGLTPSAAGEFARTDEVLSGDGRFLYVLVPSVKAGNTSHIDEYAVSGGNLTLIGATPSTLAVGVSGLDGN